MRNALIDLDNVIANTTPYLCRLAYGIWGIEIKPEEWTRYLLHHFHPLMFEFQTAELMNCFHATLREIPLLAGARPGLEWLRQRCDVIVATARPKECYQITRDWLAMHEVCYHHLILGADKSKLVNENTWLVFDDSPSQLEAMVEKVPKLTVVEKDADIPQPVRFFMRDMAFNEGRTIPHVRRVKGWNEVIEELSRNEAAS